MSNTERREFGGVAMPIYQGVYGSTHRLAETWTVKGALSDGTTFEIEVKAGFAFDGASIPRALWRVAGHPLEVPRVAAALAHDWLYASQLADRQTADEIYRAICREVGISAWKAALEYYTLRMFGGAAWRSHKSPSAEERARRMGQLRLNGLLTLTNYESEKEA